MPPGEDGDALPEFLIGDDGDEAASEEAGGTRPTPWPPNEAAAGGSCPARPFPRFHLFHPKPGHPAGLLHFEELSMSDTEPTDVSVSLSDPGQQQERELARIAREVLLANKTALFDALAAAGITTVIVNFDGYGDSGQIEMIEAKAGDDVCALPAVEIEIASAVWGSATIDRQTRPVREAIETLVYDVLSQNHGGWENNDGACGEYTFDVAERTITLDYNERHMEFDYSVHVF